MVNTGVSDEEEALLKSVNQVLSKFPEALASDDPTAFGALIADCNALLEGALAKYPEATRKVRAMRGLARARAFESSGDIGALRGGVADLDAALGATPGGADVDVSIALAQASFRLGEQSGDLVLLRRSVELFDALPKDRAADPFVGSTRATALMTIGGLSGDRLLVERAVIDLQSLIKRPGLDAAAVAVIEQNLAIALLRNANQNRSARVYEQVLAHLESRLRNAKKTPRDELLRMVQVSARFEFAKLTNDRRQLRRTELEIRRLLEVSATQPRRQLELLHQLGQCRYHRAVGQRSLVLLESAIECLEQALRLCSAEGVVDARRDRLLADLGYYSFQSSLMANAPERALAARRYFETARRSITIERAPGLYIQVTKGLFELHFREQAFAEAAAVARDIDQAARFAQADPRLTAGVVQQAPLEIIGVPERHALCLVRLGRLSEASMVLENSRGQNLSAALARGLEREATLAPEARAPLEEARVRLTDQLRGRDERSIRRAWEDYVTLRRAKGLDLGSAPRDVESIKAASPEQGALVQLCFTAAGSFALIWTRSLVEPMRIDLPQSAWSNIGQLFEGGPSGRAGWIAAYERFLDESSNDAQLEQAIRCWSDVIDGCLSTLGSALFEPLEAALLALGLEPGAPLLICPPGALALLPLSAAVEIVESSLSERWAVSVSPNAFAATKTEGVASHAQRTVVLHSPRGDVGSHLPLTSAEALAIKRLLPASVEVSDDALNPSAALAAIKAATHVHIACHGVYDVDNPSRSGLILARGERLTLTRLWAAGFEQSGVRLVFLSCCEGGMTGRTLDSDEFAGLAAALLQLGAGGVIATHWAVFDDTARVFSEGFYRRYLDRDGRPLTSPVRALAETRRWLRRVTLGSLINDGYLSQADAEALFSGPSPELRRLRRIEPVNQPPNALAQAGGEHALSLDLQPYADACHWAGWTLFGQ